MMEGDKTSKAKSKMTTRFGKHDKVTAESEDDAKASPPSPAGLDTAEASLLASIHTEIIAMRSDVKSELNSFRSVLREDVRKELTEFRDEIHRALGDVRGDLTTTTTRVEEAEQRVAELEERNLDLEDSLRQMQQKQESMQTKLTDLEARSRRNNIRVYGIPEGAEDNNVMDFVVKFLESELATPSELDLKIQRCHRALGPRPPREVPPRSIVINFQEYKTKELVLSSAWKKKEVYYKGTRVYFDHDYPTEIVKKRREYAGIRRVLKEKGVRFQTPPPAKLKVFLDGGPRIYNTAREAAEDLRKRGFPIDQNDSDPAPGPRTTAWERVGDKRGQRASLPEQVREKLRAFRHNPGDPVPTPGSERI